MATDAGSDRATAGIAATSQLEDGTSDSSPAMTAPGSASLGAEAFPLFRADPPAAHVDAEPYDGRHIVPHDTERGKR